MTHCSLSWTGRRAGMSSSKSQVLIDNIGWARNQLGTSTIHQKMEKSSKKRGNQWRFMNFNLKPTSYLKVGPLAMGNIYCPQVNLELQGLQMKITYYLNRNICSKRKYQIKDQRPDLARWLSFARHVS